MNSQEIKACHQLPKTSKQIVPTVLVKFFYFDHKNLVYGNRTLLEKPENIHPHNFKLIFLEKAYQDTMLKLEKEQNKLNLITTTYNNQVKVFVEENGQTVSKGVSLISDIGTRIPLFKRKPNKLRIMDSYFNFTM